MTDVNISSIINIIIGVFYISVLAYALPKQIADVLDYANDGLDRLRKFILGCLVVSILTALPPMAYQILRLMGERNDLLGLISGVSLRVSALASAFIILYIYIYRRK